MQYKLVSNADGYSYLYKKFLIWWIPVYEFVLWEDRKIFERIKDKTQKTLVSYCKEKAKEVGLSISNKDLDEKGNLVLVYK